MIRATFSLKPQDGESENRLFPSNISLTISESSSDNGLVISASPYWNTAIISPSATSSSEQEENDSIVNTTNSNEITIAIYFFINYYRPSHQIVICRQFDSNKVLITSQRQSRFRRQCQKRLFSIPVRYAADLAVEIDEIAVGIVPHSLKL